MANNPPANQLSGCDRISELPDALLTHILSYLPTKHSVKTSVLSRRWKNLWLSVPALHLIHSDFHYGAYEVVLSFIDRFLEFDTATRLLKVKVGCPRWKIEGLKDRISTVIKRGPQHLELETCTEFHSHHVEFMPLNLYTCKTLVTLQLTNSGIEDPGFVCMPCLKSMTLVEVHFRDDTSLEKLVSGCPVLEELSLFRDMESSFVGEVDRFMRVRSRSLKRFCVPPWYVNNSSWLVKCTLEIDAPGLEHLTLEEDHFESIVVRKGTSLFTVGLDIHFGVNKTKYFGDVFLSGISSVRHMIISMKTVEALELYSKVGLIPKFNNLSRLEAMFPSNFLQFLPAFLECCPNLKHLTLEVYYSWCLEDVYELTNVPGCLLSTLEFVQLKNIFVWGEREMKVTTYFLENAVVLKKLTLSLKNHPLLVPDAEIFEEVNKVTKRSPNCQIFLER